MVQWTNYCREVKKLWNKNLVQRKTKSFLMRSPGQEPSASITLPPLSVLHHPPLHHVPRPETQTTQTFILFLAYEYAWMHGCTRKLGMKICGKFLLVLGTFLFFRTQSRHFARGRTVTCVRTHLGCDVHLSIFFFCCHYRHYLGAVWNRPWCR